MKKEKLLIIALGFAGLGLVMIGCGESNVSAETARSMRSQDAATLPGSCSDSCGWRARTGPCWCDNFCEGFNDCCEDKTEVCGGNFDLDPCADKECGEACTFCDPADEECLDNSFARECNLAGQCTTQKAMCGDAQEGERCSPDPAGACAEGLFCHDISWGAWGPTGTCQPHGHCDFGMDCLAQGNDWEDEDCVGYVTCEENACVLSCQDEELPEETTSSSSCEWNCGFASDDGSCFCDGGCLERGDCCNDAETWCAPRMPVGGYCARNSFDECNSDADCQTGGCGGEVCFNPEVSDGLSTCECSEPTQVEGCGCVSGRCSWYN